MLIIQEHDFDLGTVSRSEVTQLDIYMFFLFKNTLR